MLRAVWERLSPSRGRARRRREAEEALARELHAVRVFILNA